MKIIFGGGGAAGAEKSGKAKANHGWTLIGMVKAGEGEALRERR